MSDVYSFPIFVASKKQTTPFKYTLLKPLRIGNSVISQKFTFEILGLKPVFIYLN